MSIKLITSSKLMKTIISPNHFQNDSDLQRSINKNSRLLYLVSAWFDVLNIDLFRPYMPYTLSLFISYFSGEQTAETYKWAHVYCFLMNLLSITTSMGVTHLALSQSCVGMKVRIASCSLLYRKVRRCCKFT